jgi:hypothetical protein
MQYTAYEKAIRDAGIRVDPHLGGYDSLTTVTGKLKKQPFDPDAFIRYDRYTFIEAYSYAIPNMKVLKLIAKFSPILELAAGGGYWAYELSKLGADVVATDVNDDSFARVSVGKHYPVKTMSAIEAVRAYSNRTILLVWPGRDSKWPAEMVKAVMKCLTR